jgi:indole-3-glycerol phosphate synthase
VSDILRRIVEVKREEVAAGRLRRGLASVRQEAEEAGQQRDFAARRR